MILIYSYENYFSFSPQPSGPAAPSVLPLLPKWLSQSSLPGKLCSSNRKLLFPSSLYHRSLQEQEAFARKDSYAPTSLGTYRPEPWSENCLQNYSGSSLQSTSSMLKYRDKRGHESHPEENRAGELSYLTGNGIWARRKHVTFSPSVYRFVRHSQKSEHTRV